MSTWHQRQRPAKLFHATKWTVVEDEPNVTTCLTLFNNQTAADQYRDRIIALGRTHTYVLPPAERK